MRTQLLPSLLEQNFKPLVINQLGASLATAFEALFRPFATTSLSGKLLIKFLDPFVLTDGKTLIFEHWMANMRNKLRANANWYLTKNF